MPISFNALSSPWVSQRLESSTVQATSKSEAIKQSQDRPQQADALQELNLKGYDQVESMAWMQTTDAALASGQGRLQAAQEQLAQGHHPDQELGELATLVKQASFQGRPLLTDEAPALDDITRLSSNPPYFMTSASEAVDLFRQLMTEKLEAQVAETSQGIPLGDVLAEALKSEVAQQLERTDLREGDTLTADFSAQGLEFHLEGRLASDSGELFLDESSQITTVVNGNELLLEGPFVRLLGPVSEDELLLPRNQDDEPQVAIHLQQRFQALADPEALLGFEPENLAERLNENLTLFAEVRAKLQENLQNLQKESEVQGAGSLIELEETVSQSIQAFSEEPGAAVRTQANASADLVLNTMPG